jgi:hypothetical protein
LKVVVVYESLWGNTAAIARAIAEGIGPEARCLSTGEATPAAISGADLVVAGAPVLGFRLPTEEMRQSVRSNPGFRAPAPDLSNPSMRSWLEALPAAAGPGKPLGAAFETGLRWSPGGATSAILQGLEHAGFAPVGKGKRFIVKGRYGPLRDGEVDRARAWGAELAGSLPKTPR